MAGPLPLLLPPALAAQALLLQPPPATPPPPPRVTLPLRRRLGRALPQPRLPAMPPPLQLRLDRAPLPLPLLVVQLRPQLRQV